MKNFNAKKFILIGVGGYIAARHLRAIKDTGNELVAALDKNDSVGIIDSYFPNASFFTEFERFDRFIEKNRIENNETIDYLTICSPNYLHDAHIRFGLRIGAKVICEKPIVLNPWNIDALEQIKKENEGEINTILQLRHHPSLIELKKQIDSNPPQKYQVVVKYVAPRGKWYDVSWKGDINKSGGVATNIGVHFFDMLSWIFGECIINKTHEHSDRKASGYLEFEKANVNWFLSVDKRDLPPNSDGKTYRCITVNGKEVEFSKGFTDLHTVSYQNILNGNGFDIMETKKTIKIVSDIRKTYRKVIK